MLGTAAMVVSVVPVMGMVATTVRVAAGRVAVTEQPKKIGSPLPHLAAGGVIGGGCWSRVAAAVGCGGFGEWWRVTGSDMGDRIDRLMGNLLGSPEKAHQKTFRRRRHRGIERGRSHILTAFMLELRVMGCEGLYADLGSMTLCIKLAESLIGYVDDVYPVASLLIDCLGSRTEEYDLWLMRIEQYFLMTDYSLWEVIKNGNKVLKRTVGMVEQIYEPISAKENVDRKNKIKARVTLLMTLPNEDQLKFHSYKDAKLLMEAIEKSTNEVDNTTFGVSTAHSQGNTVNFTSVDNLSDAVICAFLASQSNSPQLAREDLEQIDPDDLEKMDLHWEMAMLTIRARRLGYKVASPAVESFMNSSEMLENQEIVKSRSDKGYHVVPLPYTGNYIPPKPDLMFIDEQVKSESVDVVSTVASSNVKTVESKHESVDVKNKSVPISNAFKRGHSQVIRPYNKYLTYKKTIFNKMVNIVRVKDTNARERAVVSEYIGREANAVKASSCGVWKAKHSSASNTFKKYSYIDARGNKCYLTDYEDYDGEFVSFGDGKGINSGKEQTKTNQAAKTKKLKKRVKKLEGKKKKRTYDLKRLYNVGLSARVESSKDEEGLGAQEDASKQGRIAEIDANEIFFLIDETVQDQGRIEYQDLFGDATVAETVKGIAAATTPQISKDELTLAQTLMEIKAAKPNAKGVTIQEPSEFIITSPLQPSQPPQAKDKEVARKLEAEMKAKIDEEENIAREKNEVNEAIIEEWDDVQATIDVDRQLAKQIQAQEREELYIEERSKLLAELIESKRKCRFSSSKPLSPPIPKYQILVCLVFSKLDVRRLTH
nr:hypothetical protein [Tanacetum cinerariifolium]